MARARAATAAGSTSSSIRDRRPRRRVATVAGFSLFDLLVTLAVIAIVAALGVPELFRATEQTRLGARRRRDRVVPAHGAPLRVAAQRHTSRSSSRPRATASSPTRSFATPTATACARRTSSSASIHRSSPGARSLTSVAASDSAFRPVRCRAIRPAGNRSAARATIPSASTARTSRRSRQVERRRPARSISPTAGEVWSSSA